MNLALDISTSITGTSLVSDAGKLISGLDINLKKVKNTPGSEDILFKKADLIGEYFKTLTGVKNVVIEEPLSNGPNRFTTNMLIRFNGMVSLLAQQILGVVPVFLSVHEVRSLVCSEFLRIGPKNKVTLSFPAKIDKKVYIFNKVSRWFPDYEWKMNKKGELADGCLDISDSIAVNIAHLIKSGKITLKNLSN